MTPKDQLRQAAEADLEVFINLVHPNRLLGAVHKELIDWWYRPDAKSHQLTLLPRDHMKSALMGYRVAWEITRNPAIRVLYISSTSNLATKQLKFIKDILTCDQYRRYWPEMVLQKEAQREKWTETEISVDHPLRKSEAVRDPTVFAAGLTTNVVGMHCDVAVLDDVVVYENAYTEEGRERAYSQYSLLASIEGRDAREWVVGTRYHGKDLYATLLSMSVDIFDPDSGNIASSVPLYETFERKVETVGDGSGEFLWPLQTRHDGKVFGFNAEILARKRAQYKENVTQFRAQYYNDPNSFETSRIKPENFQYYDRGNLRRIQGKWHVNGRRINVFASVDFAFSLKQEADYTSIVVVGMDSDNRYYVLDIDRFKTNLIGDYFNHILRLFQKWDFRKLRAEVSVAQQVIVNDLKQNYIRQHGLALAIDEYRPNRMQGTKDERVNAILQARYQNAQIFHYQGGLCQTLEEELVTNNPSHDDIKDALASCIDVCVPPSGAGSSPVLFSLNSGRFGGVS